MRYLIESFALGALRRGKSIAQFLEPVVEADRSGIRWVEIHPGTSGYQVMLQERSDAGSERFLDVWEFPGLSDEEDFGRVLAHEDDEMPALEAAERLTGAFRDRWVNLAVIQDEYLDHIRAGRRWTGSS